MYHLTAVRTRRRTAALTLAIVMSLASPRAATRGPDAAGYTASDATVFSFIDVAAAGGASILADTDDATAVLTLPFAFPFYGEARTLLCVSSNGAVYFVGAVDDCAGIVDFANTDLSTTVAPGDRAGLFPLWSDLTFDVPGAGAVFYQSVGAPGSRKFIVQWNNAFPSGSSAPVTFQVVLMEETGQALFQYKTVDLGGENQASQGGAATVGVRNGNALVTGQYLQWSLGVPVLVNESAILFDKQRRMRGSGFNSPEAPAFRATFTIDARGPVAPSGSFQYVYLRTRMTFAATQVTNVSLSGADMMVDGLGTVNGAAGYKFTATAADGSPDRVGLVIRRVSDDSIFYSAPLLPLGGGSLALQ